MRTATCVLLVRARSAGLREIQASSKTDCRSFRVSGVNASMFPTHSSLPPFGPYPPTAHVRHSH